MTVVARRSVLTGLAGLPCSPIRASPRPRRPGWRR